MPEPESPKPDDPKPKSPWRRRLIGLGVALLVLAVVGWIAWRIFAPQALPEGLLQANGRIEGDTVALSSKFAGRLVKLYVREGAEVQAGQVLAEIDDAQVKAKVEQARQAVQAMEAQVAAAQVSLEVLRKDVPLAIANAQDEQTQAAAALSQASHDAERYRVLASHGTVEPHQSEQANLARTKANSAAQTAAQKLAQAQLGEEKIKAKEAELTALEAQLGQTEAALAEAESVQADLTLKAPASGVVVTRVRDEGETVAAGAPILLMVDLDRLYLEVYVPGSQIGKMRRGLPARISTDAFPDETFAATVRYIASRAEFTPKEVQTPDERVKLVYAVRLYLEKNPNHCLTPGLPADAVVRWKEGVPWAKARW